MGVVDRADARGIRSAPPNSLGVALAITVAVTSALSAQAPVRGTVIDSVTSRPVSGASVADSLVGGAARTDADGRFYLPGVSTRLLVRAAGYVPASVPVERDGGQIVVRLVPALGLAGIEVQIQRPAARAVFTENVHLEGPSDLFGGIASDPLAALSVRGVRPANDLSALVVQRGGSPDEVGYSWEGIRLWGPTHVMGLFSVFNPLVTSDLVLLRNDMPGAISGVTGASVAAFASPVDERSRFSAALTTVDIAASSAFTSGPASFLVAGRRGLDDSAISSVLEGDVPHSFWDAQVISRVELGAWSIEAAGFGSDDEAVLDASEFGEHLETGWRNGGAALRVHRPLTERVHASTAIDWSAYDAEIRVGDDGVAEGSSRNEVRWAEVRPEVVWTPTDHVQLAIGGGVRHLRARLSGDSVGSFFTGNSAGRASVASAYATATTTFGGWSSEVGGRVEDAPSGLHLLPRLTVVRDVHPRLRLGLAGWSGLQVMSALRDLGNAVPTSSFWFANPSESPRTSTTWTATAEWRPRDGLTTELQLFRRRLDGVPTWGLAGGRTLDDVVYSHGTFHGFDVSLSGSSAAASFLASYAFQSGRMRAGPDAYLPPWMHDHTVSGAGELKTAGGWYIRMAASWGAGTHQWLPTGQYPALEFDGPNGRIGTGDFVPIRSAEQTRLPFYLRVDARLGREFRARGADFDAYVDVVNATDRPNVSYYRLGLVADPGGVVLGRRRLHPVLQFQRLLRVGISATLR